MFVTSRYFPPFNPSSHALAFQINSLVDSYMIWVGVTEGSADDIHTAASRGRLTLDWACAMLSKSSRLSPMGTSLFRATVGEVALPMAQRLARRFKKQIFLSVDMPPAFMSMGEGTKLTFEVEKRAVELLKELEDMQSHK